MLRFLLRFLLFMLVLALAVLAAGPLLIDPTPAPGATNAKSLARDQSAFVQVPVDGLDALTLHYLEQAAPAQEATAEPRTEAVAAAPRSPAPAGPYARLPWQMPAPHAAWPAAARPAPVAAQPPAMAAAEVRDGEQPASSPPLTLILLHGFTFNAFTWTPLMDALGSHGRVLAYDQIPYGLSDKPLPGTWQGPNPYGKAAAVQQLFAFMDALGVERAVLVGNSSGGTLALEAALARPEQVQGLILLGPWVHAKRPIFPDWIAGLPQVSRLTLLLARYLGGESPLLDYSYADPSRIDAERRALTGIHRGMANWDAAWGALLNHSLTDPVEIAAHLREVTQPVLVATGAQDQVVPVADTKATAAALPDATFAELPGCGHLPQEECPDLVSNVVDRWLVLEGLVPGDAATQGGGAAEPGGTR